jgi:hypothetical protein
MQKLFVVVFLLLIACSKPLPDLAPIDLKQWKADKDGCLGYRQSIAESLMDQTDKLKGLSEKKIIELLGRPDRNELYKRNQKFYYYLLEPGAPCAGAKDHPIELVIRFNAMGYAKEVSVDRSEP